MLADMPYGCTDLPGPQMCFLFNEADCAGDWLNIMVGLTRGLVLVVACSVTVTVDALLLCIMLLQLFSALLHLQILQEMMEEAVSQLMSIQSQRANVPQNVLFPFVPRQRPRQLPSPVRPKL